MHPYLVTPVNNYLPQLKDKHRIILEYIQGLPVGTPIEQRMQLYNIEIEKLKSQFSSTRKNEYSSKSVELSVEHSCTSSSSGGVKNCGFRCIGAPALGLTG